MAWLEITVKTQPDSVESVAAMLTFAGFSELVVEDAAEFQDFLEENRACWDYIDEALEKKLAGLSQVKLYLEDTDAAGREKLDTLLRSHDLTYTVTPLPEADYDEDWKQNYPPVFIGKHLVVLPHWLDETAGEGRTPIFLDPGLSFGTGSHPTTAMVLEQLEAVLHPGDWCLDLGSGSGILSIGALRLGAGKAVGVDIDPLAENMARENASYNGFAAPEFTALTGSVTEDTALMDRLARDHYHVVLVNIVADVILKLAPVLPQFLAQDSTAILSGILDTRLPEVQAALEKAGLTVTGCYAREEWRCLTAVRRCRP